MFRIDTKMSSSLHFMKVAYMAAQVSRTSSDAFVFTEENFRAPSLPSNLKVHDVPLVLATDDSLAGFGKVISSADELTCEKKNFEIVKWPGKAATGSVGLA